MASDQRAHAIGRRLTMGLKLIIAATGFSVSVYQTASGLGGERPRSRSGETLKHV